MGEKAKECRCNGEIKCSTHLNNKLEGEPFCANGRAAAETIVEAGCNCQGCPIHKDFAGVQFCMGNEVTEARKRVEETVIDLTPPETVASANPKVIDLTNENLKYKQE